MTVGRCAAAAAVLLALAAPATAFSTRASLEFGGPQPWQSRVQGQAEHGSWVKHSSPAVADLDPAAGNGPEILIGSLDGELIALRLAGGALQTVWSTNLGTFVDSSPAAADLDGDGTLEVLVGAGNEFAPANAGLYVLGHDGRRRWFRAAPAPAGGPANHVGVFSSPAVGDVDGDGRPDVVWASFDQQIYATDAQGRDLPGFPKQMHDTVWSSPALTDIDGDGRSEIVIGSDLGGGAAVFGCPKATRGMVMILQRGGGFVPGWPKCMDTPIWSTPAVRDVDGDGVLDVVVGTNNYVEGGVNVGDASRVYAWATSGRELWRASMPAGSRVFSSPAIGDVDGDGGLEVAVGTVPNGLGEVVLLDARTASVRWRRDDASGARYGFLGSPVMADASGDGVADVLALGGDGRLHVWNGKGDVLDSTPLGLHFANSPAVGDLDGDGTSEVVAASGRAGPPPITGKVWVLATQGRANAAPWPMFKRTADRTSAAGTGTAAPAKQTTATPRPVSTRRPPRPTVVATPALTAAPAATDTPQPVPGPTAVAAAPPPERPASPSRGVPIAAAAVALIAAAGLVRRRVGERAQRGRVG